MSDSTSLEHWLRIALVSAIGLSFFFFDYPPMIDVPQHAAQVSLLDAMLRGESAFAHEYELNFLTPYLLGYSLWLLASQLLSLHNALSLILALAFIGSFAAFSRLRARFGAPGALDLYIVPGFFGFAFEWGMLTFLLSIPVGLYFLSFYLDYLEDESLKKGLLAFALGALLIASHGLVFAYFFVLAGLFALGRAIARFISERRFPIAQLFFFLPLGLVAILYSLRADELSPLYVDPERSYIQGAGFVKRAYQLLHYQLSSFAPQPIHLVAISALLLGPLLLGPFVGLRLSARPMRYLPLAFFLIYFFAVPHDAMDTSLLYQRFSLLFLPSFALVWDRSEREGAAKKLARVGNYTLLLVVALISLIPLGRMRAFDEEARDFQAVLRAIPEEQRVLALIYDRASPAADNPAAYVHFVSWYAAEKRGLVDFNFAWFPPQIVRYRKEAAPEFIPSYEWRPDRFRDLSDCNRYDYLVVRKAPSGELPRGRHFLRGSSCSHRELMREGPWVVFARSAR